MYTYITSNQQFEECLRSIRRPKERCIDLETTSKDPYRGKIRLLQISDTIKHKLLIDLFRVKDKTLINTLIQQDNDHRVVYVGQNLKFDYKFLLHNGFVLPACSHDIMIGDQVLNTGKKGLRYSLDALCERYLHKIIDKSLQRSGWASPRLTEKQLEYAAHDIDVLYPIYRIQKDLLEKQSLEYTAWLEFECIKVIADMELQGVKVDFVKLHRLKKRLLQRKKQLEHYLITKVFYADASFNLYSPQQLKTQLNNLGVDVDKTNKETLLPLVDKYPFIQSILTCRHIQDMLSRTFNTLPTFKHPLTQRIHSSFFQLPDESNGAATGRFASADPNMQNIPSIPGIRKAFIPRDGFLLCDGDFSQIEIRVIAELTQDTTLIDIFKKNLDVYIATASSKYVLNIPKENVSSDQRNKIKGVVLGMIFGMWKYTLQKYIMSRFGIYVTTKEAETLLNGVLNSWSGVKQYHNRVKRERPLVTRTLTGRVRYFNTFQLNSAINAPIQGTAADIIKLSMIRLYPKLSYYHAKMILSVHDELVTEYPEKYSDDVLAVKLRTMKEAAEEILTNVPVIVDGGYGRNWFEAKS